MFFEFERQERILTDIKGYIYSDELIVKNYEIRDAIDGSSWRDFTTDEVWLGRDSSRWFKTSVIIPENFGGKFVEFEIITGREGDWDATNPQALFYIDDEIVQGIDVNHTKVTISSCAVAGRTYNLKFLMYSGIRKDDLILKTKLLVVDKPTEKLYYDLLVPIESARTLGNSDDNTRKILLKSSKAVDLIDLRAPYSESYYTAITLASEHLKLEFYTKINKDAPLVSAIGHTHIDIAWLWTVSETKEKVLRSFATVLRLMEEYPDYKFMSSQPILYQFVKEQEPKMFERIKERVKEGRWEVDGGMWLEADCNIPSGESLIRQIIKGEKFFQDEFGIKSKSLWLPDVFGYSAALPQILTKCGIKYFMTTKICWNQFNMLANDTFMWKGLDGSEIFTYMPTTTDYNKNLGLGISFTDKKNTTTYTGVINPNMALGTYNRFQNKDLEENTLMLYGFGDGGGGPTKEMLEQSERLQYGILGIPRVEKEFEGDFFDRVYNNVKDNPLLPTWHGELYFEYHRGTYTSMAKNKRFNRKSEILYRDLECLSSFLSIIGGTYPIKTIEDAWDIILLNQFHDIIPGTSIDEVYNISDKEYAQILSVGKISIDEQMNYLASSIHAPQNSIVVYNSLGYDRDDIVTLTLNDGQNISHIIDSNGEKYAIQYTSGNTIIFFAKNIPSMGYKVFTLVDGERLIDEKITSLTTFENNFYSVDFNDMYEITSLIEKETGKEFIKKGQKGNVLLAYEDRPINWDCWDIDIFHKRKLYDLDEVLSIEMIDSGKVRTTVKICFKFVNSIIEQYIYLYNDIPRIDFHHKIDWKEHNILLKAGFAVDINATKATYEIQFGNVERETTSNNSWDTAKFETCGHKWANISDNSAGISLLNDCKYGYDIKNSQMNITLIKAGTSPNPNADMGHHEFTYSIYPHKDNWIHSNTVEMAYNLNTPLHTAFCDAHKTNDLKMPLEKSFMSVDHENCFIETVKQAEDGMGTIIRVYEYKNKTNNISIKFAQEVTSCFECDMLENNIREINLVDNSIKTKIVPFEIKTYRLLFKI